MTWKLFLIISLGFGKSTALLNNAIVQFKVFLKLWNGKNTVLKYFFNKLSIECDIARSTTIRQNKIVSVEWGLTKTAMITVYKGFMPTCATCCSPAWFEIAIKECGRQKLLFCQRIVLLGCLNVCKTVSTEQTGLVSTKKNLKI